MINKIINGVVLNEQVTLTLSDLSRACTCNAQWIVELVEEGILEPQGIEPREWRFSSENLGRAHKAMRLQRDLEVNIAGIALILNLMDQLDSLQSRLQRHENS